MILSKRPSLQLTVRRPQVHLVDWLGTGLSARPAFDACGTAAAEAWFVDALEDWRAARGLERIVLVGHSLGGYLSAAYALRHPGRVQHLVLVCPAGMVRARQFSTATEEASLFPVAAAGNACSMAVAGEKEPLSPSQTAHELCRPKSPPTTSCRRPYARRGPFTARSTAPRAGAGAAA